MTAQARFHLHANGPFDHAAVMANLSSHAVTGLHDFDATTQQFSRWINISGTQQWVQLKLADDGFLVTTDSPDSSINSVIAARVKHWFDLDTDLSDINAHLRRDDIFSQQVKERPGIRIVRHQAPFEGAILAVLAQQVTLATGRLFAARLVEAYGNTPTAGAPLRMFPSAKAIASISLDELRATLKLTNSRAKTIHEVAQFFADRGYQAEHVQLPAADELSTVYGIGPWTLAVLAIRSAGDKDAFPTSDAVLRRMMKASEPRLGQDSKHDEARISTWSPYRSYAAQRLWASAQ